MWVGGREGRVSINVKKLSLKNELMNLNKKFDSELVYNIYPGHVLLGFTWITIVEMADNENTEDK